MEIAFVLTVIWPRQSKAIDTSGQLRCWSTQLWESDSFACRQVSAGNRGHRNEAVAKLKVTIQ